MRILAIGDPHGDLKKIKKIPIKDINLILITGDSCKADLLRARIFENVRRKKKGLEKLDYDGEFIKKAYMEIYNSSLSVLKYFSRFAPTYFILGNIWTDRVYDSKMKKEEAKYNIKLPSFRQAINKIDNFYFVRNVLRIFNNLRIGFLEYFIDNSWIKEFNEKDKKKIKSAKKETEKAKRILERFSKNLDILICHQPPYGYLDKVSGKYGAPKKWVGKHAGSKVILNYIKKYQPKYVFCGHIHEGEGKVKIGKTEVYNLGVAGHRIIELNK